MSDQVTLHIADRVGWITIDRPEKKNAFTQEMMTGLLEILRRLEHEKSAEVVVVRATGGDFCSGADVGPLSQNGQSTPQDRAASFERGLDTTIQPLLRAWLNLPQPVIASARGYVIGLGMQFVLAADLVVASRTSKYLLNNVKLGHVTDHGESWLLPRRIGPSKALEMCLVGDVLSAADAERFGIANWLTDDADLETKTGEIVAKLLRGAPFALRQAKALLRDSAVNDFEQQMQAERSRVAACAASDDFAEAMQALQARRAPQPASA